MGKFSRFAVSRIRLICRATKMAAQGEENLKHLRISFAVLAAGLAIGTPAVRRESMSCRRTSRTALQQRHARSDAADRPERLSRLEAEKGPALDDRLCQLLRRQYLARQRRWIACRTTLIPKWKKLGLISEVIITQSNLNDADANSADAPARRPGRRCDHRLLLQPDSAQSDRPIRL